MKSTLNIVFLIPGFPVDERDTKCLPYIQEYLLGLKEYASNVSVKVISIEYPATTSSYLWHDIPIYPLGISKKGIWGNIKALALTLKTIKKIQENWKIDMLHSFWLSKCAFIGHWASKLLNIPHISTAMGVDVLPDKNRYLQLLPLQKMNLVMVSDFQAQQFEVNYKGFNVPIIPWGISEAIAEEIPQHLDRPIDLLAVGDINPIKDYPFLIEVMKVLVKEKKRIKMVVIGRDLSMGKIQSQIQAEGLDGNIKILGVLPNEKVLAYMKKAKVLLHVSRYESQGFVFSEALKSGMHIISRKVGVATHSAEWKIASDVSSFSKAIESCLANPSERKTQILFPIQKTVSDYLQLYQQYPSKINTL